MNSILSHLWVIGPRTSVISQVAKIISNTLNPLEINGMSQLILTKFQVYQEEEVN